MPDSIIRVQGLGKKYQLGRQAQEGARYRTLRDSLSDGARSLFQRDGSRPKSEEFWALKNVSFEVKQGEVVGIIGRNGAGKSTLLKVLSRITEPTTGKIRIGGRVASLLEVGTGFHPELTGRENIFLNGAVLGMSRSEIKAKFDEIVAFADIERFLDTPVKRYSSGMYVRLAFAVAAHLEPEILIVDEVLAVGDAEFQAKCLGKMKDVSRGGRTVLFVSHNMGAISQLCSRAILFSDGKTVCDASPSDAVSRYLLMLGTRNSRISFALRQGAAVQITEMALVAADGKPIGSQPHTDPFSLQISYCVSEWPTRSYLCLDVFNHEGTRLLWSSDVLSVKEMLAKRNPGSYRASVLIPGMVLSPGVYYFTAAIYAPGTGAISDLKDKVLSLEVNDGGSILSQLGIQAHAATAIPLSWETITTTGTSEVLAAPAS